MAAAGAVLVSFTRGAWALIRYPWDWSPDEGLALDYARRLLEAPETLYARTVVPFPVAWTPLLPAILAPVVRWSDAPLASARLLACVWTLLLAGAVFVLVRRRARWPAALASAALALAPLDYSFWHVLVRVDGLMIALWLAAAAVVLPDRLEVGAARLSWGRAVGGATLLLAAVLAKPTAVVHGAPLVLGWLLVDRASAARLAGMVAAGGLLALGFLQWASGGAFLWVMGLWGLHPRKPGLFLEILLPFLARNGVIVLFAVVGFILARRRGERPERDGALLMLAGGLLTLPATGKAGSWWNYLLPGLAATTVLGGRLWTGRTGPAATAALALTLASTRDFPLPTAEDATTARAFYGEVVHRGAPLLATRPDYAYFLLGQPVEVEGSSLPYLAAARAPGLEVALARLRSGHYRLLTVISYFWPADPAFEHALLDRYRIGGVCALGFFYGRTDVILLLPKGDPTPFDPPPEARCRGF